MTPRVRNLALRVVLATLRGVVRTLSALVPQSRSVVVSAYPETEGNGVEAARALLRRYPGQVVWLRERGESPREVRELEALGARLVPKVGLAGLWCYLRAEAVFFTHGLYGSPRPVARKPLVNLWHGDGPKDVTPRSRSELIASTYVVGSSTLFTHLGKCVPFEVSTERAIVTGNPRTDQLWRPASEQQLRGLGIDGDFVVWMPTYRRARAVGAVLTSDAGAADDAAQEAAVGRLLEGLQERGMQLVVKPHPMDADRRADDRWTTVTEDELVRAGVSLYELLGASAGLVTDYSSVWTDYLLLDRPMAFLVTDRRAFGKRLVPADVLDWLPGQVVEGDAFGHFLADLDAAGALGSAQREQVARRIGLNRTRTAGDDLVTELGRRSVLRLDRLDRLR